MGSTTHANINIRSISNKQQTIVARAATTTTKDGNINKTKQQQIRTKLPRTLGVPVDKANI